MLNKNYLEQIRLLNSKYSFKTEVHLIFEIVFFVRDIKVFSLYDLSDLNMIKNVMP